MDRDNGLEVWRPVGGRLEGSDAPVGAAPHADAAVAPGLRCNPLDGIVAVLTFLGIKGNVVDAFRRAQAAEINDQGRIAAPGKELMDGLVPKTAPTVLVIRNISRKA